MAGFQPVGLNGAHDVACLKSFRTFEQVELHALALIQSAIAVLLDGGEMHEDVFAGGPLDEAKPFGSVEPLHCSLLSHKLLLSPLMESPPPPWRSRRANGARSVRYTLPLKQKCRTVHRLRETRVGRTACDCLLF